MLNNDKVILPVFFYLFCFSLCYSSGNIFTVSSLTPSSVKITFSFQNNQRGTSETVQKHYFGISSLPSVQIKGTLIQSELQTFSSSHLEPISQGWIGKNYVQWFSLTLTPKTKQKLSPDYLKGDLSFSYNRPILAIESQTTPLEFQKNMILLSTRNLHVPRIDVTKPNIPYSWGLRMGIPRDGVYQISGFDLEKLGIAIEHIPSKFFRLFCRDKEIPLHISNSFRPTMERDDIILFYGKHLRGENHYYTQYSNTNIYWLTWHSNIAGTRVADASGNQTKSSQITFTNKTHIAKPFTDTVHFEYDTDIRWQGNIFTIEETTNNPTIDEHVDNWYWGIIGNQSLTHFTFPLPSPVKNDLLRVQLKIQLTGLTSIASNPKDHQFEIHLNDQYINSPHAIWDGQNDYLFQSNAIEANKLIHGINSITFSRLQDDSLLDLAALNWIDIIYSRGFDAFENKIHFSNNNSDVYRWIKFDLTGFATSNLELWDIRTHRIFNQFDIKKQGNWFTLSFQDSVPIKTRYFAQAKDLRHKPYGMILDTLREHWDFPIDIDYIMISTKDLIPELQPLIDAHTESGLRVEVFDIQDIYNCFSFGLQNPESIRTMVRYLYSKQRENPPRYLLFGGDASHDQYKKDGYKNVIPTHLTRIPNWGPASDDGYFATVHGNDNFPDLCVGRFPARDPSEMRTLVAKTVRYLRYPELGPWRDNMLLIGGFEPEFTAFNNEVVSQILSPRMNCIRMDADPKSPYYVSSASAANKIADHINTGTYFINFTGHGGGNTWSDSKFFSYSDIPKLHNSQWGKSGRLPIVFSFTCLTGFFESVFYQSLGEEFLRQSADGCIAFYGASAYTKRNIDIQMARTIMGQALGNTYESLGALIQNTEILMLVMKESESVPLIRQYNLLGDPAIPWEIASGNLSLSLPNSNIKGTDTLTINSVTSPIRSGSFKLSVSGDNLIPWADTIGNISDGAFTHQFHLKHQSKTAHGVVRGYVWNDTAQLVGWTHFSKDTFSLSDVRIIPTHPGLGDSVTIFCRISLQDSLYTPTVQCRFTLENPLKQNIIFPNSNYLFMEKEKDSEIWTSKQKIPVGTKETPFDITKYLICKFFSSGKLGVSDIFSFPLEGRPDLLFTAESLYCTWSNESLTIEYEILNKGNVSSQPFTVSFMYPTLLSDTVILFQKTHPTPLLPGNTIQGQFSLPDTQGIITYTGLVNKNRDIKEFNYTNNTTTILFSASQASLFSPSDTIHSFGTGCYLVPTDTLTNTYTFFLLPYQISVLQPLQSQSEWIALKNDSISGFIIHSRPPLAKTDSIQWNFIPANGWRMSKGANDQSPGKIGIVTLEASSKKWKYRGGVYDSTANCFSYITNGNGPIALASISDVSPPEIQVFVGGKEITYLDYAAQNRPFSIFMYDSTSIDVSSIQVLLNNQPLNYEYQSSAVSDEHKTTVSLTAYPPKINSIDTLKVSVKDNAGNLSIKNFAYRPGENLNIRFFSCHPNPFSAKRGKIIRFAFLITDIASSVTMTIYTISGRKVWRWKNSSDLVGYQEIAWDGTTENKRNLQKGYRLANGTYYAKLVAKNDHKKVIKTIRIAKLEGF